MKIEFTIPYPPDKRGRAAWSKRFSLNAIYAGKHWSKRLEDKEFWHWLVRSELQKQKVPCKRFERPVRITFLHNCGLDIDNCSYEEKMIVDSLIGPVLIQDDRRYYTERVSKYHDGDGTRVMVEEI